MFPGLGGSRPPGPFHRRVRRLARRSDGLHAVGSGASRLPWGLPGAGAAGPDGIHPGCTGFGMGQRLGGDLPEPSPGRLDPRSRSPCHAVFKCPGRHNHAGSVVFKRACHALPAPWPGRANACFRPPLDIAPRGFARQAVMGRLMGRWWRGGSGFLRLLGSCLPCCAPPPGSPRLEHVRQALNVHRLAAAQSVRCSDERLSAGDPARRCRPRRRPAPLVRR